MLQSSLIDYIWFDLDTDGLVVRSSWPFSKTDAVWKKRCGILLRLKSERIYDIAWTDPSLTADLCCRQHTISTVPARLYAVHAPFDLPTLVGDRRKPFR